MTCPKLSSSPNGSYATEHDPVTLNDEANQERSAVVDAGGR
jgi:hypothetical protein